MRRGSPPSTTNTRRIGSTRPRNPSLCWLKPFWLKPLWRKKAFRLAAVSGGLPSSLASVSPPVVVLLKPLSCVLSPAPLPGPRRLLASDSCGTGMFSSLVRRRKSFVTWPLWRNGRFGIGCATIFRKRSDVGSRPSSETERQEDAFREDSWRTGQGSCFWIGATSVAPRLAEATAD